MLLEKHEYFEIFANKKILMPINVSDISGYSQLIKDVLSLILECKGQIDFIVYDCSFNTKSKKSELDINARKVLNKILADYNTSSEIINLKNTLPSYWGLFHFNHDKNITILRGNSEILRSIHSLWFSKNWNTLNFSVKGFREKMTLNMDVKGYLAGKKIISQILERKKYEFVLIPNGKYPVQVGMKQQSELANCKVLFYEHDNQKVFLQKFQTQDFDSLSRSLNSWIDSTTESERKSWIEWSSKWLINQENNESQNIFLGNQKTVMPDWKLLANVESRIDSNLVTIFTNSLDEKYSNLPREMNGWNSQVEAILAAAERIRELGLKPHIRLHPNTQWKSVRELIEIVVPVSRAKISFQFPWEGPSTYWLIKNSKFIVTWGSTVALESLAKGIPAVNLGPSRYQHMNVIHVLNQMDLKCFEIGDLKVPNIERSLLAIYALKNYGIQNLSKNYSNQIGLKEISKPGFFQKILSTYNMLVLFLINPLKANSRNLHRMIIFLVGKERSRQIMIFTLKFLDNFNCK